MSTIVFTDVVWREMKGALDSRDESAAVLIARPVGNEASVLLVRGIHWVPDDQYQRREPEAVEIRSAGYVHALKVAADDGAVALFFHTHPGGAPRPSRFDDGVDERLREPFAIRTGTGMYGSFILGGSSDEPTFSGRLLRKDSWSAIDRVRVVGSEWELLTSRSEEVRSRLFDRQIRVFGVEGQHVLRSLRIGVVGLGGTGSAVSEQLVRMGVGDLLLIDDDFVSETNLTRIHESGMQDVGKAKVEVAKSAAERIGLGTKVEGVTKRITQLEAARLLRDRDVIFGCTDDNRGRAILSRIAYWYLIPVIDTAFLVDTDKGQVRGLFGRITLLYPGAPCLLCRNRIDARQLLSEGLGSDERERLAAEGYVPGLGEPDPSVGTYTTLTASLAVSEFLARTFGLSDSASSELLLRLHDRVISRLPGQSEPDHYCADPAFWGKGDGEPFLDQLWV